MEFNTYTSNGLTKILHEELNNTVLDINLINRINVELKDRLSKRITQMTAKEQTYWILKDINFSRIQQSIDSFSGDGRTPSKVELASMGERRLRSVMNIPEDDYGVCSSSSGGFHAYRFICDGVMSLSLKFVISSWDMDFDSVTSENYSDTEYKPNWCINDVIDMDYD